jgi:hypothetical protein
MLKKILLKPFPLNHIQDKQKVTMKLSSALPQHLIL